LLAVPIFNLFQSGTVFAICLDWRDGAFFQFTIGFTTGKSREDFLNSRTILEIIVLRDDFFAFSSGPPAFSPGWVLPLLLAFSSVSLYYHP